MDDLRQAAQALIDFYARRVWPWDIERELRPNMEALRAALAQPEQKATSWAKATTYQQRLADAVTLLCAGKRPPDVMVAGWIDRSSDDLQSWCIDYGPSWAQGIVLLDAAAVLADTPTEGVDHGGAQPEPQAEPVQCERCGHTNWVMEGKAPCQITEGDRGALAQPEPVAYRYWKDKFACWEYSDAPLSFPNVPAGTVMEPLYLHLPAQPEQQPEKTCQQCYDEGVRHGAEAERERCAKICDAMMNGVDQPSDCARAIRERT